MRLIGLLRYGWIGLGLLVRLFSDITFDGCWCDGDGVLGFVLDLVCFELVIIVIWGGFSCCDCSLVLLALFALVSGGLRLWFWFTVGCLLAC